MYARFISFNRIRRLRVMGFLIIRLISSIVTISLVLRTKRNVGMMDYFQ